MLAKLVNTKTNKEIMRDKFSSKAAMDEENQRAQEETKGRLQWKPLSAFEIGLMTAQVAVLFGGKNHANHRSNGSA